VDDGSDEFVPQSCWNFLSPVGTQTGSCQQDRRTRQSDVPEIGGYPDHRPHSLLRPTQEGREAVGRIAPAHAAFAQRLAEEVGFDELRSILDKLTLLSEALMSVAPQGPTVSIEQAS
jgi:hypothetical protein